MKKLCLIAAMLLSTTTFADDLKCLASMDTLKAIFDDAVLVEKKGDLQQVKNYNNRYDYSALFNDQHPNQYYYVKWISESEYDKALNELLSMAQKGITKNHKTILQKPKTNFIASVGEVCVIPMHYDMTINGKDVSSLSDQVFVRNLSNNEWRVFTYDGNEDAGVLEEFFPGFAQDLKQLLAIPVIKE